MGQTVNDVLKNVFDLTDEEVFKNLSRDQISKWDSLAHMDLVVSLESTFGIDFTIDEIIELLTLDSVREVMSKKGVKI